MRLPGGDSVATRQRIAFQIGPGDSLESLLTARRISRAALYEMLTNQLVERLDTLSRTAMDENT